MNCRDFLARHSEYVDGLLAPSGAAQMMAHAATCASCARYDHVVRRGTELAREVLQPAPVSAEFAARMRHRLFHERDDATRRSAGSSIHAAAIAVLVMIAGAGALTLQDADAPVVDARVVFAAAPATFSPLAEYDEAVTAAPALPASDLGEAEAAQAAGSAGVSHDAPARKSHDDDAAPATRLAAPATRLAAPGPWPVYSRGAAALAFHRPKLAQESVPLRGNVRTVATPLLVRY